VIRAVNEVDIEMCLATAGIAIKPVRWAFKVLRNVFCFRDGVNCCRKPKKTSIREVISWDLNLLKHSVVNL